jgi:hypothetical protein
VGGGRLTEDRRKGMEGQIEDVCEGKDEAMASRGAIFQSVAGTGSRSYILK